MSLDKHQMILRGWIFPHHTVCGAWFYRQYEHTCTELAQLQQLMNRGGHSTAWIWLSYLPELTLYAAEICLQDAKPEFTQPAGCGQFPTKLSKVSLLPQCNSSYKQDDKVAPKIKRPEIIVSQLNSNGRPAPKHILPYIVNHVTTRQLHCKHTAALSTVNPPKTRNIKNIICRLSRPKSSGLLPTPKSKDVQSS